MYSRYGSLADALKYLIIFDYNNITDFFRKVDFPFNLQSDL